MKKIIFLLIVFFNTINVYSQADEDCQWNNSPFTPTLLYGKQGPTITAGVQQYIIPSDCTHQKYIWTFSDGTTIINWETDSGLGSNSASHTFSSAPFNVLHQVCLTIECHTSFTSGISCKSLKVCQSFPIYACEFKTVNLGNDVQVCDDDLNFVLDAGPGWSSYKWFKLPSSSVLSNNQTYHPTSSGTYVVEVSDPSGGSWCTKRDTIEVTLIDCNACNISASYQTKQLGFCRILFSANVSSSGGTQSTGYYWDFGDGNTSTDKDPIHQYIASGTYTVQLTIIGRTLNGQCCTKNYSFQVTVTCDNSSCLVNADFSFKKKSKYIVQFTNNSISNNATTIAGYYWDFGDGNTSTDKNPIHQYSSWGIYQVCLTVYGLDSQGNCCEDTYCNYTWVWSSRKLKKLLRDNSFSKLSTLRNGKLQMNKISKKEWNEIERLFKK